MVTCPQQHTLTADNAIRLCDKCQTFGGQTRPSAGFSCHRCDYDLCKVCHENVLLVLNLAAGYAKAPFLQPGITAADLASTLIAFEVRGLQRVLVHRQPSISMNGEAWLRFNDAAAITTCQEVLRNSPCLLDMHHATLEEWEDACHQKPHHPVPSCVDIEYCTSENSSTFAHIGCVPHGTSAKKLSMCLHHLGVTGILKLIVLKDQFDQEHDSVYWQAHVQFRDHVDFQSAKTLINKSAVCLRLDRDDLDNNNSFQFAMIHPNFHSFEEVYQIEGRRVPTARVRHAYDFKSKVPAIEFEKPASTRHEANWGANVQWSKYVRISGTPPFKDATVVRNFLQSYSTLLGVLQWTCLQGTAAYNGTGYIWFKNRFDAQQTADKIFHWEGEITYMLDNIWIRLLPGQAYFEPMTRNEWSELMTSLPEVQCKSPEEEQLGNAKRLWDCSQKHFADTIEDLKNETTYRTLCSKGDDNAILQGTTEHPQDSNNMVLVHNAKSCFLTQKTLPFKPGPIGINYDTRTGQIRQVFPGGQARTMGVQVDWIILKIDNQPYSQEKLGKILSYRRGYSITFQTDFNACRLLRGDLLESF